LEIEDGSHDLVFNGIRTENCTKSYGVKIKSHDGVAVCYKIQINNYFSKNDSAGLTVENGCYQVDIRGVNIESNVASSRGLVIGYTNAQSADVNISDIYINVLGVGIMLYGGTNIKFSNGRIVTQYYGIQFATTSNLVNISFSNLIVNSADSTVMASAHTATRTRLKFVNCYLESAANTIYLQGGTWDRLTFESCKIVIPYLSGSGRRAMLTNCFGIDFVNTRISSLSASGIVLRYSGGDINISGCQISAVTHAINIGNEDTNTGNFTDIRIDGVDVSTVTNAITVKSVAAAQVANLMILNSKFKLCKVVNWTGDQNPDKITINNNQCTTTTYADPTSGTNLVKSGNNPAALA
jgi:hypothetical protein